MPTKTTTEFQTNPRAAPRLDVRLPDMPVGKTHVFSKSRHKFSRVDQLMKAGSRSDRSAIFHNMLIGIWNEIGQRPVPFAFRTQDGKTRSMDIGSLAHLYKRSDPAIVLYVDETTSLIVAVEPIDSLAARATARRPIARPPDSLLPDPKRDIYRQSEVAEPPSGDAERPLGFDPTADPDVQQRQISTRVRREGAREFRRIALANWNGLCPLTGCTVRGALDAAHICRYGGEATNDPRNGLLLRADMHRLLDRYLISLSYRQDGILRFHVSPKLRQTSYGEIENVRLAPCALPQHRPHRDVVVFHFAEFERRNT